MNCRDWEERLALYAGGDLAPAERAELERHLGECAGCQVFLSGMAEGLRVLREAHADAPAEAHFAAVRARVLAQLESKRRPWWTKGWIFAAAAAAAVLLIALAVRPGRVAERPPVLRQPEVAVVKPPAPVLPPRESVPVRKVHRRVRLKPAPPEPARLRPAPPVRPEQPLVVKLVTDDPDVVIYWIGDTK